MNNLGYVTDSTWDSFKMCSYKIERKEAVS